jgi:hypothetical protein
LVFKTYVVNTLVAPDYTFKSSVISSSDNYCSKNYEVSLWTDTNSDTIKDASEYSVIPLAASASPFNFYKNLNTDRKFHINILKPLTNADVGMYYLKSKTWVDTSDSGLGLPSMEVTGDI